MGSSISLRGNLSSANVKRNKHFHFPTWQLPVFLLPWCVLAIIKVKVISHLNIFGYDLVWNFITPFSLNTNVSQNTDFLEYPAMFKCMIFLFRTFQYKTGNVLPEQPNLVFEWNLKKKNVFPRFSRFLTALESSSTVVTLRRSCWEYNRVKKLKIFKSWFNLWENCWLHSPLAGPLFLSPAY